MKIIIYADVDKLILAVRAAKALDEGRKDGMFVFESGSTFYINRNKGGSLTVRQESAECSGVQLNTPKEHQMHETAPNAQQKEQDDTKSP